MKYVKVFILFLLPRPSHRKSCHIWAHRCSQIRGSRFYSLRGAVVRGAWWRGLATWVSDLVGRREDLNAALEGTLVCVWVCVCVSVLQCECYSVSVHVCVCVLQCQCACVCVCVTVWVCMCVCIVYACVVVYTYLCLILVVCLYYGMYSGVRVCMCESWCMSGECSFVWTSYSGCQTIIGDECHSLIL